jgi:hypothetical protein
MGESPLGTGFDGVEFVHLEREEYDKGPCAIPSC